MNDSWIPPDFLKTTLPLGRILAILILAAIYGVTAKWGLDLGAIGGVAAPIWPPTGISLAALLLSGYRLWPGIALGAFAVNFQATHSVFAALGITTGNTLEAVVAVYFLRRFKFRPSLERVRDATLLIGIGALGSTLISATIGVISVWLSGSIQSQEFLKALYTWWLGDVLGDLVVAPFLLVWGHSFVLRIQIKGLLEALIPLLFITGIAALQFINFECGDLRFYIRIHHLLPFLIWVAIRFGQRGLTAALLLIAALATWGTIDGFGPFTGRSSLENLLSLQSFIGVIALTLVLFGAIVAERGSAEIESQTATRKLRSERDLRDRFVFSLTHDLRTPLTAAKMSSQLICRQADVSESIKNLAHKGIGNINRADKMIQDLLDAHRVHAGQILMLQISEVNLEKLVKESLEDLKTVHGERFVLQAIDDLKGHWCPQGLRRILENLCSNAIKYGSPEGPITVSLSKQGEGISLAVHNYGEPLSDEDKSRLFDLFQRTSSAKISGQKGWGIGLTIVKGLAEAHGGKVSVLSVNFGTEFIVSLPKDSRPFQSKALA